MHTEVHADGSIRQSLTNACSSGAGGGGTKGPSSIDKRLQEQKCPFCERVFKQVGAACWTNVMHAWRHACLSIPDANTASRGPGFTF